MKLARTCPGSVLLVVAATCLAVARAQVCPDSSPFDVSVFSLPSGDTCFLCVPTMESCGVTCSCPTLQCDTYLCELTPPGCGEVACAGDGRQVFPTPAPTPVPTASPTPAPTETPTIAPPPTVPPPTFQSAGNGIVNPNFPTPPEEAREDCAYTTCLGCLTDAACGSWYTGGAGCYDTCAIADANCYNTVFNADKTPDELCGIAADDEANQNLCAAQSPAGCGGCTATALSDGSGNTCAWFEEGGGFCAPPGCTMVGCGDPDPANCPAPPTPAPVECGTIGSCGECLDQEGCDAWSVGKCYPTCMEAPMDVACYSQEYINGTPDSICQQADNDGADEELCGMQTDCGTCTGTALSGRDGTCQWYATDGPDGYCAAGCGMDGCGETTCGDDGSGTGGTPSVLPECGDGLCADPTGACRQPGDKWFLDDACTMCTCMEEGVACVGCPLQQLPTDDDSNLSISQEGADCSGITVDVACNIMGDDETACQDYLPSNSSECTVEVKYSYMAKQVAPPQNAILTSVMRVRSDSYHGSPRNFVENRWGDNLTPTSKASYEMSSWEGEFVNFCLRDIKPSTVFEFKTDVCTTTAKYELIQGADLVTQLPAAPVSTASDAPLVPSDGETSDALEEGGGGGGGVGGGTSAAGGGGASTLRFLTVFAIGGMLMAW